MTTLFHRFHVLHSVPQSTLFCETLMPGSRIFSHKTEIKKVCDVMGMFKEQHLQNTVWAFRSVYNKETNRYISAFHHNP
ncbi:Hypothetical predicted protein [Octopus vulgaris]|uniref:Uncharacterized protein n=1 Tax=Octopus vulgaris TaxID=6645 RepID=A0AA36B3P0_OCTVU|nr:Hypothetical predicted protein [Octopus vulgaris]